MVKVTKFEGEAGFLINHDNRELQFITLPDFLLDKDKMYGAFTAAGDGMINEGIKTGDLIIIEMGAEVNNGDIGVFQYDNDKSACKKYYYDTKTRCHILEFCDGKTAPILVPQSDRSFKKVGKLVLTICRK